MYKINVRCSDGETREETIYNIHDFPYHCIPSQTCAKNKKLKYISIPATLDIETTTITEGIHYDKKGKVKYDKVYGFMYLWQFCVNHFVVMGRTWREYCDFIRKLADTLHLSLSKRLVVYSHNLSFEFQFVRDFFDWENVFAKDKREVLRATDGNGIEYRCSYYLTNMSLEKACENARKCLYYKKSGEEFDYMKRRTPITSLSNLELEYAFCDVRGLEEVIEDKLSDDTLATIPMTSTGYVRRECRQAMKKNPKNRKMFLATRLSVKQYKMLNECKRGGNTHANRLHVGSIRKNVKNADVASSYPYQMMTQYYPMSAFTEYGEISSIDELNKVCGKYCCMFYIAFEGLRIKDNVPVPYISQHKIKEHGGKGVFFNGRLLEIGSCIMCVTEIDYQIISAQYDWDIIAVSDMQIAVRGQLPEELKNVIRIHFKNKTMLKGEDEYLYAKSKNIVNGIFGMTCTDPVHDIIELENGHGEWDVIKTNDETAIQAELDKFYKSRNSFLPPQWGVWVTAHARKWLQKAIDKTGNYTLYCDTDSDKFQNLPEDIFDDLNKEAIGLCEKYEAYADRDGKRYYMGIFEIEKPYKIFRTWGAKKYAYVQPDKKGQDELHITVAGVHKAKGANYLEKSGGLNEFKPGFVWSGNKNGGGTNAYWNDDGIHTIIVGGVEIETGANVGITDSDYTLGITTEFFENANLNLTDLL